MKLELGEPVTPRDCFDVDHQRDLRDGLWESLSGNLEGDFVGDLWRGMGGSLGRSLDRVASELS